MVKEIPLTKGLVALIDDEDYERVNQYKWYACKNSNTYYVKHTINHHSKFLLHRFILGVKPNEQVDHINGNGLDNRICNLRITTQSQNLMNRKKFTRLCSSKYKGVCWCKQTHKWSAKIQVNGKRKHLGRFLNEDDAGKAYNEAAKKHYGEYARLNQIEVNEK